MDQLAKDTNLRSSLLFFLGWVLTLCQLTSCTTPISVGGGHAVETPLSAPGPKSTPITINRGGNIVPVAPTANSTPSWSGFTGIWSIIESSITVPGVGQQYAGSQIVVVNPATGELRTIVRQSATDHYISDAGVSPDGKYIAFTITGFDSSTGKPSIWLHSIGDSKEWRVFEHNRNGQLNFMWLSDNQLLIMAGKEEGQLASDGQWYLVDPKSGSLIAVSFQGATDIVCPLRRAGTPLDLLPIFAFTPGRPPTVTGLAHIEVNGERALPIMDLRFNSDQKPTMTALCYSWTAGLKDLAFVEGGYYTARKELYLLREKGQSLIKLTNFNSEYEYFDILDWSLSPDARWILAEVNLGKPRKPNSIEGLQFVLIGTNGESQANVESVSTAAKRGRIVWSPASEYVAIGLSFMNASSIFVIDAKTRGTVPVVTGNNWSEVFDWR